MKFTFPLGQLGRFDCTKDEWYALIFVEDGVVGLPAVGPFLGRVDPDGKLLARFPAGEYTTIYLSKGVVDLVFDAVLEEYAGEGKAMLALHDTEQGCIGSAHYRRLDTKALLKRPYALEKTMTYRRGPYRTESAIFKSMPILSNHGSDFVLELPFSLPPCYGFWSKSAESDKKGRWSAYCGRQVTASGTWLYDGDRFEAQGIDSYGNNTVFSGRL
ncbi:hypothetical protein [Marinobacterium ramblicola]|uniref:hypothetical protein n=1 Tax=Marinobacterium ramblicola TaxID=2849041 RepID=UPI001C2D1E6E|nr:hypothetical protein [Marinobacterium ramblicola]